MNQIIITLLLFLVVPSCIQKKNNGLINTIDNIATRTIEMPSINQLLTNPALDCSIFNFKNALQQADTLQKYVDKNQLVSDDKFFCAFPNSFKGMQEIFGFDDHTGAAPLYDFPKGQNMIRYFANLSTIPKDIYYNK